ncbi:unnamed protein product, partial [Mesorhabditis belari]|uniref:Tubulin polyglutamylase TTLL11 n=1 Tax=Mesorhabditis belari TaxID=2138241 RepID=A0AAF3ERZ9_9BILA
MGCEISKDSPEGKWIEKDKSGPTKVHPVDIQTTLRPKTTPDLPDLPKSETKQEVGKEEKEKEAKETKKEKETKDDSKIPEHNPYNRIRSGSVATIIMENRPPSGVSHTSFTRVYKQRLSSRPFTIDTSRAKSNQPVVSQCAQKIGITEYPEGRDDKKPCDVYWHNVVYPDMCRVVTHASARVNKFPGMTELAKKISLTHSISSMQKLFPDEYGFYPKSWFLPAHLREFEEFSGRQGKNDGTHWFIVKPDDGAQGTGIYLINSPSQLKDPLQKQLVQEYVADPLLMGDQLKFDFRVYGVIRSINPLSIYVAREGMARFCTERYSKPTTSNFENLFSHLTNYSLNKSNDSYIHSNTLHDQIKGSKRLLSTVFHQLESRNLKTKKLWHEIKMILVKTVLAMLPEIMLHYEHHFIDKPGPQCFQIIGFDVMIRANGDPVLLEVNAAPSLTIDHQISPDELLYEEPQKVRSIVDEVIKVPLVRDTLLLVLNLMDQEYSSARSLGSTQSTTSSNPPEHTADDLDTLKSKRKPHLAEIFPNRYGAHSFHLLFLDRAVYLFMQFVNLRTTINISVSGLKLFIKKCNLHMLINSREIDLKAAEINFYLTGDHSRLLGNGLPFHGFLQFVFYVAERKFPKEGSLLEKVQRLMHFCDQSLRHYGVRSARLRRTEVATAEGEDGPVEIYMLPLRMRGKRRSRSSMSTNRSKSQPRGDRNNNALSLPRITANS